MLAASHITRGLLYHTNMLRFTYHSKNPFSFALLPLLFLCVVSTQHEMPKTVLPCSSDLCHLTRKRKEPFRGHKGVDGLAFFCVDEIRFTVRHISSSLSNARDVTEDECDIANGAYIVGDIALHAGNV
jgi:hypothetical protein